MKEIDLSAVEQLVLLAIMRLGQNAYGVSIRDKIKEQAEKEFGFGTIYAALERMEDRGLIASREGESTAERGGKRKLYFSITGTGVTALSRALNGIDRLRQDIDWKGAWA